MPEAWTALLVTENGYEPFDKRAREQHGKMKLGNIIGARIMRSRSLQAHRHYWAVVNAAAHAIGYEPDKLHSALLVATGRINLFRSLTDGRLMVEPKSSSYAEMNAEEFREYTQAAFRALEEKLGVTTDELLKHGETE